MSHWSCFCGDGNRFPHLRGRPPFGFLAEGDKAELDHVFAALPKEYGTPVYGGGGKSLDLIASLPLPASVLAALQNLPHAGKVQDRR